MSACARASCRLSEISVAFNPGLCGDFAAALRKAVPRSTEGTRLGQACRAGVGAEQDEYYDEEEDYYAHEL